MAELPENWGIVEGGPEQEPETPYEAIRDVKKQLKKAERAGATEVEIAGEVVEVDPAEARKNSKEAFKLVKASKLGKLMPISEKDVGFQALEGKQVGMAGPEGVMLDPKLLRHPAVRIAHVLAHEFAHHKDKIPNEGLVESFVEIAMQVEGNDDAGQVTEKYKVAMAEFDAVVNLMNFDGKFKSRDQLIEHIYKLYLKEKYEDIYMLFERYIQSLPEDQQDGAFAKFEKAFPELRVDNRGDFNVVDLKECCRGREKWVQEEVAEIQQEVREDENDAMAEAA